MHRIAQIRYRNVDIEGEHQKWQREYHTCVREKRN